MHKKILIFMFLVIFLHTLSYAAWTKYFVKTPTTSNGNKIITLDSYSVAKKSLSFKTSGGTVNISITIYEDDNSIAVKTLSFTEAGSWKYTTEHRMDRLRLVWTVTSGSLDQIVFKAN